MHFIFVLQSRKVEERDPLPNAKFRNASLVGVLRLRTASCQRSSGISIPKKRIIVKRRNRARPSIFPDVSGLSTGTVDSLGKMAGRPVESVGKELSPLLWIISTDCE